jgi:hypothetical protein
VDSGTGSTLVISEGGPHLLQSEAVDQLAHRHCRQKGGGLPLDMATIVLRVRFLGGDHTDLTYEDPDQDDEDELVDQVVAVLGQESGVLRCRHGERLVAIYSRGVASLEVSPRGAIL